MGSFGFFGAPRCNGCRRWAYYIADGFGPACDVCQARWQNDAALNDLLRMFPVFAERLPDITGALIVEFVNGDGREENCECGQCLKSWADRGWICPWIWAREINHQSAILYSGIPIWVD